LGIYHRNDKNNPLIIEDRARNIPLYSHKNRSAHYRGMAELRDATSVRTHKEESSYWDFMANKGVFTVIYCDFAEKEECSLV